MSGIGKNLGKPGMRCIRCTVPLVISDEWQKEVNTWLSELESHHSPDWREPEPPIVVHVWKICRGATLVIIRRKFGSALHAKIVSLEVPSCSVVIVDSPFIVCEQQGTRE
jgi:hypothetical protein